MTDCMPTKPKIFPMQLFTVKFKPIEMYTKNSIFYLHKNFKVNFILFWPPLKACRILVPPPRIEPMSPAVEAQSLNH